MTTGTLRTDDSPVLVVGGEADGVVHRAVAGVAFGPGSARAAAVACRLLAPGGVLSLVHVHEEAWLEHGAPTAPSAGARLQRLAAAVRGGTERSDLMVGTATLFGPTAAELVDYARRVGAELIAVGGGSVAEELLRLVRVALPRCSVLVVPA